RPVHWLQKEVTEIQLFELLWFRPELGKHEFQFVTASHDQISTGLGADTNPINSWRRQSCSIRLDGDFKVRFVQGLNERFIYLEQCFAASADDERPGGGRRPGRPMVGDRHRQATSRGKSTAAGSVGADKVCITELTNGCHAIGLST